MLCLTPAVAPWDDVSGGSVRTWRTVTTRPPRPVGSAHGRGGDVLALPDADDVGARDMAVPAVQVQARVLRGRAPELHRRRGGSIRAAGAGPPVARPSG